MPEKTSGKGFEEAMEKLEAIADELASGQLTLDEAIRDYEKAAKLHRRCQKMLDGAAKRIRILSEKEGQFVTEDEIPVEDFKSRGDEGE